ncbi:MAG: hypothetical protein LBT95_04055 [Treponema sp.]|jgi:hypothetical protein|nr:hypothetical protein [Treponema sp.]
MGFFTVGNLLTLAIVALVLVLYRQFDRQSRTLDKIHKYADRLKEELSTFVAEKEGAVRDYGIALKVQQDAAKELMKRLQMTDEELAEKVVAVTKIDERISAYDASLEELVRMTGRVQENLNRIRDESAFVEKVHKRISDTKTKLDSLESEFESLLPRFEQENADALEKVSDGIIASVRSSVSDLGAQLETIERQVEDHREAINIMERTRADNLDRDMALINNALKNAVEQAGLRADKIEESALIKLREQAQERIRQLHDLVEEKLKAAQESAREQILDVQGSIRALKDDWQSEYAVFEIKRQAFKDEWIKDTQEFKELTEAQRNALRAEMSAGETQARQLLASIESAAAETQKNIVQETGRIKEQLQELQAHADEVVAGIEANLVKTVEAGEARVLGAAENRFESWKTFTAEAETQVRRFLEDFEISLEEAKRQSDNERLMVAQQLKSLETHTEEVAAAMEARLTEKTSEAEAAVVEAAMKRLEEWQTAVEAAAVRSRQLLVDFEAASTVAQNRLSTEIGEIRRQSDAERFSITQQLKELEKRIEETALSLEERMIQSVTAAEAGVTEAAAKRLEEWQASVETVTARSRQTLADFEAAASEGQTRLNAEMAEAKRQSDAERLLLTRQLAELETHIGSAAAALEERLAQSAAAAEAGVTEAAAKRLEEWQASVETVTARSRQMLADFETAASEGQTRFNAEMAEAKRQSDAERLLLTRQLAELEARIGGAAAALEERLAQSAAAAEAEVTAAAAKRLEEWRAAVEAAALRHQQLLTNFGVAAADAQSRFNAEITETKQQGDAERLLLTRQLTELEARIGGAAAALEERLAQSAATAEAGITEEAAKRLEEWRAAVEAAALRHQQLLTDFEAAAADARSRFNAEITETKQQRDTERVLLAQQLKDLETHIGEAAVALEERLAQSAAAAEAEVTAAAAKRLEEWQTALEAAASRSQRLLTDFEAAATDAQSRFTAEIAEAKQQRDTERVLLAQQLKELEAHIEEATLALEERLTQSAAAAEAEVTAAGIKRLEEWQLAVEAAAARSQRLLEDFETAATEAQSRFNAELEEAKQQRDTERFLLSQQLKGLESHTDEAAAALEKRITQTAAEAEAAGTKRLEEWHTALETAASQSRQLLTNFEAAFSEARTRLIAEMEETKQQSETERLSILQQLQDLENHIEEASTALEERLIQTAAAAETEAAETGTKRLEEWRAALEAATVRSRQFLADFEAASAEAQARLETELGETKQQSDTERLAVLRQLQDLDDRIKDAAAALEERLIQSIAAAETEAAETGTKRLEEWRAALEAAVARNRQFLADFEAASAEVQSRLKAEMEETKRQGDTERLLVIQQLKELETHTGAVANALEERLTQTVTAAEAEVTGAAENRLKDWETAAEAAAVRSRQMLADFEAAASEAQARFDSEIGEMSRRNTNELGAMENRLENIRRRMDEISLRIETELAKVVKEAEEKALVIAEAGLEKWLSTVEQAEVQGRKLLADLEEASAETEGRISAEAGGTETRLRELQAHTDAEFAKLEEHFIKTVEELEQRILEEAGSRLEEYRAAQAEDFKRLETLTDDASRLDEELRFSMNTVETRIRDDFLRFEQDAADSRESTAAAFNSAVEALKADLNGVEQELAALKARAYENVSEKLDVFEADFSANLTERSGEIDKRLTAWQESLDLRLRNLAETSEKQRRDIEHSLNEELRKQLTDQNERLYSELDRLKAETGAFEEGIRDQMKMADDSLDSFKEQLDQNLAEVRSASEAAMKTEVGRYGLTMAEALKQQQRDLETRLKTIAGEVEERNNGVLTLLDASRREIEEWQSGFSSQLREVDVALEDARRRTREMVSEGDERLTQVRSAIEDVRGEASAYRTEIFARTDEHARTLDSAIKEADRHIKEFISQTKLFDRADELKLDLERRIEDLRGDLDGLDQRRAEAAQLENQFVKIKRLEDEVNFKMTRFLSEKYRIEQMESDFNRLLQTSKAVEEKLIQVSSSDDTLQGIQIQIRRLDDALAATEEKYQRIEKKNQTLNETNDSIDQNFKALQESENVLRRFNADLHRMAGEMESVRGSVENLGRENEKARGTAEKLVLLEASLSTVEERIAKMQVAREWLARTETRLEELNKDAQEQVKLMGDLLKNVSAKGGAKEIPNERGTLYISDRDNVVKLARQGWTVDEIAKTMKISRSEVELILEMGPKI